MSQPEPFFEQAQDREVFIKVNINLYWKLQGIKELLQKDQNEILDKALGLLLEQFIAQTEEQEIIKLQNEIMGINES